jgi:ribonucleoside-triphosphate reductase
MNKSGKLFNLEATPAEGATYKLAKKSLKQFPDIKHRGLKKAPYFTNSCHIPVEYQDRLDLIF